MTKSLTIAALAVVSFLGANYLLDGKLFAKNNKFSRPQVEVDNSSLVRDGTFTASYKNVVDRAAPSVVYIYTSKEIQNGQAPMSSLNSDPLLRYFFGDRYRNDIPQQQIPQKKRQGLGSGVIVSEDGYILTNTHVVDGADEIEVVLSDGKKTYEATMVGTDPQTDIAVLKIEERNLPAITLADSNNVEVGDVVFAIGNPLGVGQSVTMGIVSAKGRSGFGMTEYEDFIQTDASINPGNSGGALVNAKGRLIGINTFIVSRSGGNQGLGFAVPVNLARYVMDQLTVSGKVSRGLLGVIIQSVTNDIAEAFDLKNSSGALVSEVNNDSPAEKAGLEPGDIITEIDGKAVENHSDLRTTVAQTAPGTDVKLKVIRDGKEKKFTVTLGELNPDGVTVSDGSGKWGQKSDLLDGVQVDDLSDEWRYRYRIPDHVEGVFVKNVDPNSPAYYAGLRAGNIITAIDRRPVKSAKDAIKISERIRKDRVLLHVRTPEGAQYLVVKQDD